MHQENLKKIYRRGRTCTVEADLVIKKYIRKDPDMPVTPDNASLKGEEESK